jgi:hypothetical protein
MGKRTEDEIQRKLADLEVAMKHEKAMKEAEDAVIIEDDEETELKTQLARVEQNIKSKEKAAKKKGVSQGKSNSEVSVLGWTEAELYRWGGAGALGVGFLMMLSHIVVGTSWNPFGAGAFVILPFLIGLGMLIYNYKSKAAQIVTVGGFAVILFTVFMGIRLFFTPLTLLDLIILALPTIGGVVLLAKSFAKQREAREDIKLIE